MLNQHPPVLEVVITARPSWARVRTLIQNYCEISGVDNCRVSLVGPAVSSRYGDISDQIHSGIKIRTFPSLRESDDLASIALSSMDGAVALAQHWRDSRPDCVLVIADRTETVGASCAAALMQIPLIHLQGGEVSGSIDNKIRSTNSKLADLHLTTNELTKSSLMTMGESEDRIRVVGCPSIDIVKKVTDENSYWTLKDIGGVGCVIEPDCKYGIVMFHPDTLDEQSNEAWIDSLISTIDVSGMKWFWFWPNPDHGTTLISKKLRTAREANLLNNVRFVINVLPDTFIKLAVHACVLIGNSSFGIRESSFIGLPVINLGDRQKNRQRGPNVMDLQFPTRNELLQTIDSIGNYRYPRSFIYGDGGAGVLAAHAISNWQPSLK